MNAHPPSWERLLTWLIVGAIALQVLAGVLPILLTPLVILAATVVVLRLVWFYTNR
jgi:hypothetical protein